MEEPLEKVLSGLLQKSGTTGAMVVDKNGLALASKGSASEKGAGAAKAIVDRAKRLGEAGQPPSICIETDSGCILLEEHQNNTIVLFRSQ